MATFAALKLEVADDCARDDIAMQINQAVLDAVEMHSTERFWFNETRALPSRPRPTEPITRSPSTSTALRTSSRSTASKYDRGDFHVRRDESSTRIRRTRQQPTQRPGGRRISPTSISYSSSIRRLMASTRCASSATAASPRCTLDADTTPGRRRAHPHPRDGAQVHLRPRHQGHAGEPPGSRIRRDQGTQASARRNQAPPGPYPARR